MTSTVAAVNQSQSLAAIRNFIRASVSCITYARGLCSDNCFEQRPFLGLSLKHMIPSTQEAVVISEWIEKGAFDALNKNYLKEMSLCVYNAKCTELLESYCFGFTYSGDGQRATFTLNTTQQSQDEHSFPQERKVAIPTMRHRRCSKQEVQKMLTSILTHLVEIVELLPPLLSERVLTMRLTYYDEVTPATYEPPCFAPASKQMCDMYQNELQYNVNIGKMDTCHHLFSVSIRHPLLCQIQKHGIPGEGTAPSTVSFTNEERRTYSYSSSETDAADKSKNDAKRDAASSSAPAASGLSRPNARHKVREPPMLHRLLSNKDHSAAIREEDMRFLLCTAFCWFHCNAAPQRRGILTLDAVKDYVSRQCPLDISFDQLVVYLNSLADQGVLSPTEAAERNRRRTGGSGRCREEAKQLLLPEEWSVSSPHPWMVASFLNLEGAVELLRHEEIEALDHLHRRLVAADSELKSRRDTTGRMSCAQKRRRTE